MLTTIWYCVPKLYPCTLSNTHFLLYIIPSVTVLLHQPPNTHTLHILNPVPPCITQMLCKKCVRQIQLVINISGNQRNTRSPSSRLSNEQKSKMCGSAKLCLELGFGMVHSSSRWCLLCLKVPIFFEIQFRLLPLRLGIWHFFIIMLKQPKTNII